MKTENKNNYYNDVDEINIDKNQNKIKIKRF